MKIYRTVEAVPSRLEGVLHVLRSAGGKGYSRDTLLHLMQPAPLRRKEDADTLAKNSLDALFELSADGDNLVIEKTDERGQQRVVLGDVLASCKDPQFSSEARRALRAAAIRATVDGRPNQFAEVLAWLKWMPAHDMPEGHSALKTRLQASKLDLEAYGLNNDARWDNVVYWARYVGLLWQWKDESCRGLVLDAAEFIREHTSTLLEGGAVPFVEFRQRLGSLCPALDGGEVHARISEGLAEAKMIPRDHAARVSPAVSLGLRSLREAGVLDYGCPDDQREFFLMTGDEKVAFVSEMRARR
jgi:hypothetical protein